MNFAVLFYVEWGGGGKRGRRPVLTLLREEKWCGFVNTDK